MGGQRRRRRELDELQDGGETGARAVEGEQEDGEDLRDGDVEDQVPAVVGCV